jgi:hypothetical protein
MVTSKTAIANLALSLLGAEKVPDISDPSILNASYCRQHYGQALDEALRAGPWSFAVVRISLVRSATAPAFGWSYQYPIPSDCVQILDANSLDPDQMAPEQFQIEGGLILSNSETMQVRYISRNDDPATYPADFVNALSYLLASKLAVPITGNAQMGATLKAEYDMIEKPRAIRQNSNESRGKRHNWIHQSDLVNKRYGG